MNNGWKMFSKYFEKMIFSIHGENIFVLKLKLFFFFFYKKVTFFKVFYKFKM